MPDAKRRAQGYYARLLHRFPATASQLYAGRDADSDTE